MASLLSGAQQTVSLGMVRRIKYLIYYNIKISFLINRCRIKLGINLDYFDVVKLFLTCARKTTLTCDCENLPLIRQVLI